MNTFAAHTPYIIELRTRVIRGAIFFLICFAPSLYYGKTLFHFIASPLLEKLPESGNIIATQIFSSFTVPLKLSLFVSLLLSIPYWGIQIWCFVGPALYRKEKRSIITLSLSSILLFYVGAAFAFFIVCPMALGFFINMLPPEVSMMTDMANYLNFILTLTISFGLAFQVPIIVLFLIKTELVSVNTLKQSRRYVIVGAFIVGMLLTPPDVLSQIMLAIPLWALFELGLWFGDRAK